MLPVLLVFAILINLPINAAVLWLACRWLNAEIRYLRAFSLVVTIFVVGWLGLLLALLSLAPITRLPWIDLASYVLPPLGIVVPLAILKLALRTGWWRTLGIFVVWRILSLAQFGPTWLLLRPHVLELLDR